VWRVRTRRGRRGWTGRRVSRASQDSPLCVRARAQRPLPSVCYVGNDRSRTAMPDAWRDPNVALSLRAAYAAPARADRASSPAASAGTAAARPTRASAAPPAVDRQPGGDLALGDPIRRHRLTCADSNALRTPRAPSCLDRPNRSSVRAQAVVHRPGRWCTFSVPDPGALIGRPASEAEQGERTRRTTDHPAIVASADSIRLVGIRVSRLGRTPGRATRLPTRIE
jgi:hypothetical protein